MTIDPTTGLPATTPGTSVRKDDGLGRDAFLSLLVTQLQHQNPLEPQADGEFLAQLAQFSSLEQLETIKSDIAKLREFFEAAVTDPTQPSDGGV